MNSKIKIIGTIIFLFAFFIFITNFPKVPIKISKEKIVKNITHKKFIEPKPIKYEITKSFDCSILKGKTTILLGDIVDSKRIIKDGALVINNDIIRWIGKKENLTANKETIISTNSYIYPGFIDSHDHIMYNFLPKWNSGKFYKDRYEWQKEPGYFVNVKKKFSPASKPEYKTKLNKYGEIKALIAGTTMVQGTWFMLGSKGLVRNLGTFNMCKPDTVSQSVFPLKFSPASIIEGMNSGKITKYLIHAGEGIDLLSKSELYQLEIKKLLRKETVIIHGTAFGEEEFKKMKANGVNLIWSPRSNMWLYNTTTKVDIADKCGIKIALSPDWSVTSSNNIIEEIQYANKLNKNMFHSHFSYKDLFKMITINPAEICGFGDYLGSLDPGKQADIVLIDKKDNDPYKNIMKIGLENINGVFIHGQLYYGIKDLFEKTGKANDNEMITVKNTKKYIDITENFKDVPECNMKLSELMKKLKERIPYIAPVAPGVKLQ